MYLSKRHALINVTTTLIGKNTNTNKLPEIKYFFWFFVSQLGCRVEISFSFALNFFRIVRQTTDVNNVECLAYPRLLLILMLKF